MAAKPLPDLLTISNKSDLASPTCPTLPYGRGLKSLSSEQANGFCFYDFLKRESACVALISEATCVCINN